MDNIVDFLRAKQSREFGASCVLKMDDGSIWYKYSTDYTFEVRRGWSIEFWAQSTEEAESRVQAMRMSLEPPVQIIDEEPC